MLQCKEIQLAKVMPRHVLLQITMLQISFVSKIWFLWQVGDLSYSIYLEIIEIGALPTSCQLQVNGWMFGWLLFACGLLMQLPHVTPHLLVDHLFQGEGISALWILFTNLLEECMNSAGQLRFLLFSHSQD